MLHCDGAGCYSDGVGCYSDGVGCYSVQDVGATCDAGCCNDDLECCSVVCIIIGV